MLMSMLLLLLLLLFRSLHLQGCCSDIAGALDE
jgi:hypothetical protein